MNNTTVKNQIENSRSLNGVLGAIAKADRLSKLNTISSSKVLKLVVDTDKKFRRGDVAKIDANVVKEFTGSETATDDIIVGIIKVGNWQTDGYTFVYILIDGEDYVYVTEEVSIGDKLLPTDDNTTPTPIKRFVKKATGSEVPYWVALEHGLADTFVKVKFFVQGGGGGDTINIASVVSRLGDRTYEVNIYSGWDENYDLPVAKLLYSGVTMKTPNLNDTLANDRLSAGTQLQVREATFTEDDGEGGDVENTYWMPVERVGLP